MRIVAALFVIFIHTDQQGYMLYSQYPSGSARYWIYLLTSVFSQFAVPLFFAISGALLLERKGESYRLLIKRIIPMTGILFFFSLFYGAFSSFINGEKLSFLQYLIDMYSSNTYQFLWFLYAYIAFLVSLPLLRAMVQNLKTHDFLYLFGMCCFFEVLPIIELFLFGGLRLSEDVRPTWALSFIFVFPCLGYFLEHKVDIKKTKKYVLLLWLSSLLIISGACVATYYSNNDNGAYFGTAALLTCTTIFITVKYLSTRLQMSKHLEMVIKAVGGCTFGIYLLHIVALQNPISKRFRRALLRRCVSIPMIGIWVYILYAFVLSGAVTYILKKIPGIKN